MRYLYMVDFEHWGAISLVANLEPGDDRRATMSQGG